MHGIQFSGFDIAIEMDAIPSFGTPRLGRLAAGLTAAVAALVAGLGTVAIGADGAFPTAAIADFAVAHFPPGSGGGQCIIFAERVVDATAATYGLHPGFPGAGADGYFAVYAHAGAQLVAEAGPGGYAAALGEAQRGDILQLSPLPATWPSPWMDPGDGHQHTAILLDAGGSGSLVIDSNWDLDLRVRVHPLADVVADAARWRLLLAIWGFGTPWG